MTKPEKVSFIRREPVRVYVYSVLGPTAVLLVSLGFIDSNTSAMLVALGTTLLGIPATELARSRVSPV